jgi:hypothetical protein
MTPVCVTNSHPGVPNRWKKHQVIDSQYGPRNQSIPGSDNQPVWSMQPMLHTHLQLDEAELSGCALRAMDPVA